MIKWAEIATRNSLVRFQELSKFLKKYGIENEFHPLEATAENFAGVIQKAFNEYDAIRVAPIFSDQACRLFPQNSVVIETLGASDSFVKIENSWWTRCVTFEALQRIFVKIGTQVDLSKSCLVVGAGSMAKISIGALSKIGISEFKIAHRLETSAQELIEEMQRKYFGVKFSYIPKDELVLLPGDSGVVVNTTPLRDDNEILKELYYFNFLKPNGLALDFVLKPLVTPFLREAHGIGAIAISGFEVSAVTDMVWVEQLTNKELPLEEYKSLLEEKFGEEENAIIDSEDEAI